MSAVFAGITGGLCGAGAVVAYALVPAPPWGAGLAGLPATLQMVADPDVPLQRALAGGWAQARGLVRAALGQLPAAGTAVAVVAVIAGLARMVGPVPFWPWGLAGMLAGAAVAAAVVRAHPALPRRTA